MRLTDYFITKTDRFKKTPEQHGPEWTVLNNESPEMEVCEFLYSLTRLIRPERVLETGGGTGNSSAYIAQGLKENKKGKVTVLEPYPTSFHIAEKLWQDLGVQEFVEFCAVDSYNFDPGHRTFQLMFLDSEPTCRFSEVNKFYPNLDPGGLILIHDLNWTWPGEWEDFEPRFGRLLKSFALLPVVFNTPRGLTMFQKPKKEGRFYQYSTDTQLPKEAA